MSCTVAPIGTIAPTGSDGNADHPPTPRTAPSSPDRESPARLARARNSGGATGAAIVAVSQVSCPTHRTVEDRPEGGTYPAGKPQRRLSVTRPGGSTVQYPALAPSCGRPVRQWRSRSLYLENWGVSA